VQTRGEVVDNSVQKTIEEYQGQIEMFRSKEQEAGEIKRKKWYQSLIFGCLSNIVACVCHFIINIHSYGHVAAIYRIIKSM
jgi:hypothetical protein